MRYTAIWKNQRSDKISAILREQKWQKPNRRIQKRKKRKDRTKTALIISLVLHVAALVIFRDVIMKKRSYTVPNSVYVDLVSVPESEFKNKPEPSAREFYTPNRTSGRRTIRSPEGRYSSKKLPTPPRSVVNKPDLDYKSESKIPAVIEDSSDRTSLPTRVSSSESAKGAGGSRRGVGSDSGSRSQGKNQGGLTSVDREGIIPSKESLGEKLQVYNEAEMPLIRALQEIAQHMITVKNSRQMDITFIIDTSESMQDNIDAVRKHLDKMIDRLQKAKVDFTLGIVRFHHSVVYEWLGMDITITNQTSDIKEIKKIMKSIAVSGGERALDALMKAFDDVKFRPGADRHFILVTDEYVKGTYPVSDVLRAAKRSQVTIDVIGKDEPFQRNIAKQTGGLWMSIEEIK
ncbi:VWA domain-containing protein [Candidatus Poribacteria bacterium]|nr:VWA domain-containing protein [Candidatus Poribacteria bacterium]